MLKICDLARANTEFSSPPLLSAVSLELEDGICLSVAGTSGSGKSIFLRAIADLDPTVGEIFLDGIERNQIAAAEWRKKVAYVPAESGWWDDRVGGHFKDLTQAGELATEFGMVGDVFAWPIRRLSTGERQRLSLIRALVQDPRVLLLDEPTSGLDEETTAKVEGALRDRLNAGGSIILVSHDPGQRERMASNHFHMKDGVLSVCGDRTN